MKKAVLLAIVFLCGTAVLAQNFQPGVGPAFSMKASVSYPETPEGRQNGIAVSNLPGFGVSSYYPVSESSKLGIVTDINYETYSYVIKEFDGNEFQNNHSYLTINPNFCFNWFLFGFNFGIPLSANFEGNEIDTDNMNTTVELITGGHFNLFDDETGRFVLFFELGYMLSGIYDEYDLLHDPLAIYAGTTAPIEERHNPKTASITIGFSYLFNVVQK